MIHAVEPIAAVVAVGVVVGVDEGVMARAAEGEIAAAPTIDDVRPGRSGETVDPGIAIEPYPGVGGDARRGQLVVPKAAGDAHHRTQGLGGRPVCLALAASRGRR